MQFYDDQHESAFYCFLDKMQSKDCYHSSAAYLLSLDRVCRDHASRIFDFENDVITPESLHEAWQTGTSKKTCRLLFSLWNGYCSEGEPIESEKPSAYYQPESIFCSEYMAYYFESIKLRFPDYA